MVHEHTQPANLRFAVLTASDRSSSGEREDISGVEIGRICGEAGWELVSHTIVADDKEMLKKEMIRLCDILQVGLVITTGGTGLAPRDFTPDATLEVIEKLVPGMAEAMRLESLKKTPHAMLSRAICGIRGKTLIVNLPGSPKAVRECLEVIIAAIPHAVALLGGGVSDCAR